MSFEKILVAIDTSPLAAFVFEQAATLAERENARCRVFHCIDSSRLSQYAPILSLDTAEEKGQELLQLYQQKASAWNISADFSYGMGEPGQAICDTSREWGADLIVVGRRGHSGVAEMLIGSVSNYVVHHAPCSVLVIQGNALNEEIAAAEHGSSFKTIKLSSPPP